jgi:hypothetical protein
MRTIDLGLALLIAAAAATIATAQPTTAPTAATTSASERKLAPIDWAAVREAVRSQRLQRTKFRRTIIAANAPQPSLPMLLPMEQRIAAADVNVFPQADAYAASMRMGDITVEVHGDRRALALKADNPVMRFIKSRPIARLANGDVPFTLDKTEGGFDLTFSRFGAAYLVSIECRNPEEERCTKTEFIRALAENMGLFGKDSP